MESIFQDPRQGYYEQGQRWELEKVGGAKGRGGYMLESIWKEGKTWQVRNRLTLEPEEVVKGCS